MPLVLIQGTLDLWHGNEVMFNMKNQKTTCELKLVKTTSDLLHLNMKMVRNKEFLTEWLLQFWLVKGENFQLRHQYPKSQDATFSCTKNTQLYKYVLAFLLDFSPHVNMKWYCLHISQLLLRNLLLLYLYLNCDRSPRISRSRKSKILWLVIISFQLTKRTERFKRAVLTSQRITDGPSHV
jgi:hypothetical protein